MNTAFGKDTSLTLYEKKRFNISIFLYMMVFWRVVPIKVVQMLAGEEFTSMAIGFVLIMCSIVFVGYIFVHRKIRMSISYGIVLIGFVVIGLSVLKDKNEYNVLYLSYFIRYVMVPLLFLQCSFDLDDFLQWYTKGSIITFLVLGWAPLLSNNVFDNYMDYGFNVGLPCTLGLFLLAKNEKRIIYWILFLASLFFSICFGNRSIWVAIILLIVMYGVFIDRWTVKKSIWIVSFTVIGIIIVINLREIIEWLISINIKYNYDSHALQKISQFLDGASLDSFASGRESIYNEAFEFISQYWPFGSGIGGYEMITGSYSHNYILDMTLYWGAIGTICGVLALLYVFVKIVKTRNKKAKKTLIMLFCLWIPKLLLSGSFIYELPFWTSLIVAGMIRNEDVDMKII